MNLDEARRMIPNNVANKLQETDAGCWEWTGHRHERGYGRIVLDKKNVSVHRLLYELFNGPIPDGWVIDHMCENKPCSNPAHLDACTHTDNIERHWTIHPERDSNTHCSRGHKFDDVGWIIDKQDRACKKCYKMRQDKYEKERKAMKGKCVKCEIRSLRKEVKELLSQLGADDTPRGINNHTTNE